MACLYSLAVLLLGGAFILRFLRQVPVLPEEEARKAQARRLLEERYARGQISAAEFEERCRALTEQ